MAKAGLDRFIIRVTIFGAASAVLGLFKLPGPVGSIAFDSLPGYFAAGFFGPITGGTVGAVGHIASAASAGFPLGFIHLYVAIQMFVWCAVFGWIIRRVNRKWAVPIAGVIAIILNGLATPLLLLVFDTYRPMFYALTTFLLVASACNVIIAGLLIVRFSKSSVPGI